MSTRNLVVLLSILAFLGLGIAACNRNNGAVDRASQNADQAIDRAGDNVDRAGDRLRDRTNDARDRVGGDSQEGSPPQQRDNSGQQGTSPNP